MTVVDTAPRSFEPPTKEILTPQQLEQFQQSQTHSQILAYIQRLNEAVVGVKLQDPCTESDVSDGYCHFNVLIQNRLWKAWWQSWMQWLKSLKKHQRWTTQDLDLETLHSRHFMINWAMWVSCLWHAVLLIIWSRMQVTCISAFQIFHQILLLKFRYTLKKHGEIEHVWIMVVEWSSTFYAGCMSLSSPLEESPNGGLECV